MKRRGFRLQEQVSRIRKGGPYTLKAIFFVFSSMP
jgi:hypothetical protein